MCPVGKLSLYSGVLSVGVGDSIAALAGSLMGRTHWPGNVITLSLHLPSLWNNETLDTGVKKTVEGSAMSVLTQLVVVLLIVIIGIHLQLCTYLLICCNN